MKDKHKYRAAGRGSGGPNAGAGETLLRAEIGFWRELLADCDHSMPLDSIERMRQALALAEHRYLQFCRADQESGRLSHGPVWTSLESSEYLH